MKLLVKFFLFHKIWVGSLRMGHDQKFQSLNKIISQFFFSKIFFPIYSYKSYFTIKNIFGHIKSHIIMFSTMFWDPGVTLLRLLRCTNKRHFVPSKEHSAPCVFWVLITNLDRVAYTIFIFDKNVYLLSRCFLAFLSRLRGQKVFFKAIRSLYG